MTLPFPLPRYTLAVGAAILFGVGVLAGYTLGRRGPPTLPVQVAHAITQRAESIATQVDTVVQVRTKTLTKTLTAYQRVRDTLHDTVTLTQHIRDTGWVKQVVQRCDSLADACALYRAVAGQKFHADSDVIAAKDRELSAWTSSQPSRLSRFLKYAEVAGVFYIAGRVLPPLHLSPLHLSF